MDEAITWLLSDHLSSTSVTVDATGNAISMLKYTAYGELRTGTSTTDYQYTLQKHPGQAGQRNEAEIGLYYRDLRAPEPRVLCVREGYVARFYDPQLARFISADTIVPAPNSIKGYDRYAYVNGRGLCTPERSERGNPINYTDPSGHRFCDTADGSCTGGGGSGVANLPVQIPIPIVPKTNNSNNYEAVTLTPIADIKIEIKKIKILFDVLVYDGSISYSIAVGSNLENSIYTIGYPPEFIAGPTSANLEGFDFEWNPWFNGPLEKAFYSTFNINNAENWLKINPAIDFSVETVVQLPKNLQLYQELGINVEARIDRTAMVVLVMAALYAPETIPFLAPVLKRVPEIP